MAYVPPIKAKNMNPETLAFVKKVARAAYPNYKGRTFEIRFGSSYTMENYWDGGSKTYAVAINLKTLEMSKPGADTTNPFKQAAHASFDLPIGFGIVENSIFCGKDMGISLVIRSDEMNVIGYSPALPAPMVAPAIGI